MGTSSHGDLRPSKWFCYSSPFALHKYFCIKKCSVSSFKSLKGKMGSLTATVENLSAKGQIVWPYEQRIRRAKIRSLAIKVPGKNTVLNRKPYERQSKNTSGRLCRVKDKKGAHMTVFWKVLKETHAIRLEDLRPAVWLSH